MKLASPPEVRPTDTLVPAATALPAIDAVDDLARFARAVSHDFSSPLLAIRCFATLLIDGLSGIIDDEKSSYLSEIVTSAERMQALNEGLVTWVRARNSAVEFTDVSLEAVVRECLEAFEPRIAGQGVLVTVSALPVVCADATAVGVVLHHLVDNALRYADAGRIPTIHIGATRSGHNVTIVVRDNGIGIDLANRERVFGVFTRIDPGRDPGRPGVGLTISRTIVERLGGRLWIDAATGGGTDAAFTLPTTTTPMSTRQASVLPDVERHDVSALESPDQNPGALAAIVEFSGDAMLSKDLDGRIRTWNRAAETLYGFPANEAIGQHASILMPPERMQELQAQIDTIRTGRCIHLETVRLRKNGDRIDVSLTISPIRDASGTVTGVSVIARDATEQHQTEEQLRAFLEVAPDAIVVIEHTGVINAVNGQAEATFGYTADELVGKPLEMLIAESFRDQHRAQMVAFAASPQPRPMGSGVELCGLRRDGTEFPADIQLSTIPTRKGLLPVAAIRDITERRRLERLRDDFIGNAAHELRTPLTTLAGLGETLAKNYDVMARDDIEDAFSAMARQGDRARVLIYNLLDLSNIEGGRADFTVSEVEIGLLVDRALESTPPPTGKTVTSTVPRDLIVRFDPGRLEQIVTNLLVNAYRYGGTTIRIDAAPQKENNVMLSVLDDGAGVAPDFVSELFEPFTRGKQPNAVRGSGIGLALCRRIVRSMKGDIWYDTLSPRGAAFRISLPGAS